MYDLCCINSSLQTSDGDWMKQRLCIPYTRNSRPHPVVGLRPGFATAIWALWDWDWWLKTRTPILNVDSGRNFYTRPNQVQFTAFKIELMIRRKIFLLQIKDKHLYERIRIHLMHVRTRSLTTESLIGVRTKWHAVVLWCPSLLCIEMYNHTWWRLMACAAREESFWAVTWTHRVATV